jgi:hypothetical protein
VKNVKRCVEQKAQFEPAVPGFRAFQGLDHSEF